MVGTTVSHGEFERDPGRVEEATQTGPVFITESGKPRFVLLSMDDFERLTKPARSLADVLADPNSSDVDFEPARLTIPLRATDLS